MVLSRRALLLLMVLSYMNHDVMMQITRIDSEIDETSCICGLNPYLLDKLHSILETSSTCNIGTENSLQVSRPTIPYELNATEPEPEQSPSPPPLPSPTPSLSTQPSPPTVSTNISSIQDTIESLTNEIKKLNAQLAAERPKSEPSISEISTEPSSPTNEFITPLSELPEVTDQVTTVGAGRTPENNGFLVGITDSSENAKNAQMKNNKTKPIEANEIASALESTVPHVVSNIFSNILNLTSTDNNPSNKSSKLTSIDGSSVDIKGDSTKEISAEGEKLFFMWLDHELESLHLTASTANSIRKNAVSLFRRVVTQYINQMTKLGGSVEDNVSKATQAALGNTEHLISYILSDYIYIASGLLQILGEQVSKIGKRLDSTGEIISHLTLNPFEIVSNVIESLPNPSDYSKYFREFGKKLIGAQDKENNSDKEQKAPNESTDTSDTSDKDNHFSTVSLISKTMGGLSHTLSHWLG